MVRERRKKKRGTEGEIKKEIEMLSVYQVTQTSTFLGLAEISTENIFTSGGIMLKFLFYEKKFTHSHTSHHNILD